ncbi:site-specific integrase [Candidatus Nitrotoga sp. 1052]|uniref:site-specific integrase n=1 Tax=Candidatus Nitrotoga sp. 1052 TaxID=2886964 RepID=UPI002111C242|nr:site-specific integrase [Candidatus Nitrotoga sp. 1052]
MRTSELITLEWGDVDFQRGVVRVRRASVRKVVKTTKTMSGERDVKLLTPALEALNAQVSFTFSANGRIFHNPKTNSPWETDGQIRKTAWIPILKAANVPYRNPYQTRHTYASMLLSAGEDPMWVAHQMGHADWGMIRKTYGRWIPDMNPVAGRKIEHLWSQHGQNENKGL